MESIIIIMNIFLKFESETTICSQAQLQDLLFCNEEAGNIMVFISQGKVCSKSSHFINDQTVHIYGKLLGGKGGFGAKLKTQGGKKIRPNDNMFSKDMNGQPIAYATVTREYEQHFRQKLLQNQKVQQQLKDFKVVSSTYKEDYASTKLDSTYNAEMQENQKRLKDAMKIGMKKYLEKKRDGAKAQEEKEEKEEKEEEGGEKGKEKEELEKVDEKEDVERYEEDQVKECDEQEQQITSGKRSQPINRTINNQEKHGQVPSKMVKPNQNQQPTYKGSETKLLSAREKLKSLFKK